MRAGSNQRSVDKEVCGAINCYNLTRDIDTTGNRGSLLVTTSRCQPSEDLSPYLQTSPVRATMRARLITVREFV